MVDQPVWPLPWRERPDLSGRHHPCRRADAHGARGVGHFHFQRGIITEELFAALVVMAVVTTLMASPIFDRLVGGAPAER